MMIFILSTQSSCRCRRLRCAGRALADDLQQNFAVVRETLPLDLKQGTNEVRVTEITAHMEPDSVILRDPQGKRALQILEQNYRADPVSQGLLLSLYEGKEIDFLVRRPREERRDRSRQDRPQRLRAPRIRHAAIRRRISA